MSRQNDRKPFGHPPGQQPKRKLKKTPTSNVTYESNNNKFWFKTQDKRWLWTTLKTIREGRERIGKGTKQQHQQDVSGHTAVVDGGVLYHQDTKTYKEQLATALMTRYIIREQEQQA